MFVLPPSAMLGRSSVRSARSPSRIGPRLASILRRDEGHREMPSIRLENPVCSIGRPRDRPETRIAPVATGLRDESGGVPKFAARSHIARAAPKRLVGTEPRIRGERAALPLVPEPARAAAYGRGK